MIAVTTHCGLDGHFHGYLYGHRTGVGEENVIHLVGRPIQQALAQLYGRLMGEAAEHHMAHFAELVCGGTVQTRIIIAVSYAPPRRHSVDKPSAVGEYYLNALGPVYHIGGQGGYG